MAAGQTSYAATGATAGAAFGPWGAVIGGVVGLVADVAMQPSTPSSANGSFQNNLAFDNSGWNLGFGGATVDSSSNTSNTQGGSQTSGGMMGGVGMVGSGSGGTGANSLFGTSLGFDNSGWNVAFGGSKITSSASKSLTQGGAQNSAPKVPAGSTFDYALLFVGALVAVKWLKKH